MRFGIGKRCLRIDYAKVKIGATSPLFDIRAFGEIAMSSEDDMSEDPDLEEETDEESEDHVSEEIEEREEDKEEETDRESEIKAREREIDQKIKNAKKTGRTKQ